MRTILDKLGISGITPRQRMMFGESLREIGVLVFVFVPLNFILDKSLSHWTVLLFTLMGIFLVLLGVKVESDAEKEATCSH
jgi:hypothetical protein